MHNTAAVLENETHKLLWDFDIQTGYLTSTKTPDFTVINNKKKRTCNIVDFAEPADPRIKLKKKVKRWKNTSTLQGNFKKKLWNMKVTIIPIVIGPFRTVTKGLLKGLDDLKVGGRVETIKTTALLRTARILRRILET